MTARPDTTAVAESAVGMSAANAQNDLDRAVESIGYDLSAADYIADCDRILVNPTHLRTILAALREGTETAVLDYEGLTVTLVSDPATGGQNIRQWTNNGLEPGTHELVPKCLAERDIAWLLQNRESLMKVLTDVEDAMYVNDYGDYALMHTWKSDDLYAALEKAPKFNAHVTMLCAVMSGLMPSEAASESASLEWQMAREVWLQAVEALGHTEASMRRAGITARAAGIKAMTT